LLAFTSVYFLGSGLFNGLRPFGVKKFPTAASPPRWEECFGTTSLSRSCAFYRRQGVFLATQKISISRKYTGDSGSSQYFVLYARRSGAQ
jgi:hypothetical protein